MCTSGFIAFVTVNGGITLGLLVAYKIAIPTKIIAVLNVSLLSAFYDSKQTVNSIRHDVLKCH